MSEKEDDKRNGTWSFDNHQELMEHITILLAAVRLDSTILMSPRVYTTLMPEHDATTTIDGEIYHVYAKEEGSNRLTAASVAKLLSDRATASAEREEEDKSFRKLLAKLLALRSSAMARAMENLPGSVAALKSFDIFEVWPFLMQAVSLPGANSAMRVLNKSVTLRQTGELADFNTFATTFRLMLLEFTKLYQDDSTLNGNRVVAPGYVKIETLFCLLFLRGIAEGDESEFFAFVMDKCVSTVQSVHDFGDTGLAALMAQFVSFKMNAREKAITEPTLAFQAQGKTAQASVPALPAKKCDKCSTTFVPGRTSHRSCSACNKLYWKAQKEKLRGGGERPTSTSTAGKALLATKSDSEQQFALSSLSPHLQELAALELAAPAGANVARVTHPALALKSICEGVTNPSAFMAKVSLCEQPPKRPDLKGDGVGLTLVEMDNIFHHIGSHGVSTEGLVWDDLVAAMTLLADVPDLSNVTVKLTDEHVLALSLVNTVLSEALEMFNSMITCRLDLLNKQQLHYMLCPLGAERLLLAQKCINLRTTYLDLVDKQLKVAFSLRQINHFHQICMTSYLSPRSRRFKGMVDLIDPPLMVTQPKNPLKRAKSGVTKSRASTKLDVPVLKQAIVAPKSPHVNRFDRSCKTAATYCPPAVSIYLQEVKTVEEESDHEEAPPMPLPEQDDLDPTPQAQGLVAQLEGWASQLELGHVSPTAFAAPSARAYIDTGATYLMKNSTDGLFKVRECNVSCGGVGKGIVFTHFGYDPQMPVGRRLTFVCKGAPSLISPGYLGATGRAAFFSGTDNILHLFVDNHLFMSAPKQDNHLYPVSGAQLFKHPSVDPLNLITDSEYSAQRDRAAIALPVGIPRDTLSALLSAVDSTAPGDKINLIKSLPSGVISRPAANAAPGPVLPLLNREQRVRVDQAENLVKFLCYQSYDAVATAVSMGGFATASPLAATDIHNLQASRGPSPHYYAGYFNKKAMPPSTNPPAAAPGQTLSFDISKLVVPSVNGYTHEVRVVSEFEGYFAVLPARTKNCKDLFEAIHSFIASTYNARSYRVKSVHADAEGVMKSMRAIFGSIGIVLTLSPPGQHAQRVERYTQHLNKGVRATLDSLPYELPPELQLYLDMHVADVSTLVPNSASWPLTPYERVHNKRRLFHKQHPFLPFGTVCMVRMGDAKRAVLAHDNKRHHQAIAKSEVGVCLGMHPAYPQAYLFYVKSTNKIVPRRVVHVLPDAIPFNWQVKVSMSRTLQQFPVDLDTDTSPNDQLQPTARPPTLLSDTTQHDSVLGYERAPSAPVDMAPFTVTPAATRVVPYTEVPPGMLPHRANHPVLQHPPLTDASTAAPLVPLPAPVVAPPIPTSSAPVHVQPTAPPQPVPPLPPAPNIQATTQPPPRRSSRSTSGQAPSKLTYSGRGVSSLVSSVVSTLDLEHVLLPAPLGATRALVAPVERVPCVLCNAPVLLKHKNYKYCADCYGRTKPLAFLSPPESPIDEDFDKILQDVADEDRAIRALAASEEIIATWPEDCDPVALQAAAMLLVNVNAANHPTFDDFAAPNTHSERMDNTHNLSPGTLDKVAFLSEVPSTSRPFGLHMPIREQHEVSYNYAHKRPHLFPPDKLKAGLDKEMYKMFDGMGVLQLVEDEATEVDKNALFVPSMLLTRQKYHSNGDKDVISCRFAMIGSQTDPAMFGDTSATTADEASMLCCMSAFQADGVQNNYVQDIGYESFDVCGAFLHIDLVSPVMIITRIPTTIEHPYAGRLVIVRKSCYGLRQSNKAFADDFDKTIQLAGFKPTLDPNVYKKVDLETTPPRRCYVSTHVDDGKAVFNHRPFYEHLVAVLEEKYGELKKGPLVGFTGATFQLHSNGAFTRSQQGFARRFLDNVGIKGIQSAKAPSQFDLFEVDDDSPPCDQKLYRTLIGSLIHLLRTRYDIQKEVVHLSSKSAGPTLADLAKVHIVLRYLSASTSLGPTYHTKQGPTLVCFVDCSYGCHVDGRSHAAYSLHIGADNAPFYVSSKKQKDCVAVGSMEGEYVALAASARKVMEFRYFLESCDFPQLNPTTIYEDNMSAINLAVAPAVTRKSRHIHIRHHYIRDCVAKKSIVLEHLSTDKMLADFFTKPFGPKKHIAFRDKLFNMDSVPLAPT